MAWASRRASAHVYPLLFALLGAVLSPTVGFALVRPLEGSGEFRTSVDVVNRWRSEDRLDVMILVEAVNAELGYSEEDGGLVARLRVEVKLEGFDGQVIYEKRNVRSPALTPERAGSRTEFQIFGVLLENVPFRDGRIRCEVYDVRSPKTGLLNQMRKKVRTSSSAGAWAATRNPRPQRGLALEDPLFLVQAPLVDWQPGVGADEAGGQLHDFIHPARRYGLEQDRLQVFLPMWPAAGGVPLAATEQGLRVQVTNLEMDFALNDTVEIDNVGRGALVAGRPAALFYELDVNLLPEGVYLLSIAPLAGEGVGVLTEFNVVWRLSALARNQRQMVGEGRTVFYGEDLDAFLAASPVEQEVMLKRFWDDLNPDPENPVNEVHLEFQYRQAFVTQYFGGFDEHGTKDARGEVFMALGMPDEVRNEHMPMNFRDQDDARIKVFDRFAPERGGTMVRGNTGSLDPSPYSAQDMIPQPWSYRAETGRRTQLHSATHLQGYELWLFDRGGRPLYRNRFSTAGMGQRFLFVDRSGTGEYFLESSNIVQGEE